MKSLSNIIIDYYKKNYICFFGDDKIFIKLINQIYSMIEVGFLDEDNFFITTQIFNFNDKTILNKNISLLTTIGYNEYSKNFLLFNDDYTSPIFDKNNKIVGNAFKFDSSIIDYTKYQINEEFKIMVKLYFYYNQLKNNFNSNKIKEGYYYLINEDLINSYKEYFDYSKLENEIKNNKDGNLSNIVKSLNNNDFEDEILINDKKIILLIKNLSFDVNNYNEEINKKYKEYINKEQDKPKLEAFNDNNFNLLYYNNFELINSKIYSLLKLYTVGEKNNLAYCYFVKKKFILIELSNKINTTNKYIIEVVTLNNENNKICPLYLLVYKDKHNFEKNFKYINNTFGFEQFLDTFQFNKSPSLELFDENDNLVGNILYLKWNNQNSKENSSSNSTNNNTNLSNTNNYTNNQNNNFNNNQYNQNNNFNNNNSSQTPNIYNS